MKIRQGFRLDVKDLLLVTSPAGRFPSLHFTTAADLSCVLPEQLATWVRFVLLSELFWHCLLQLIPKHNYVAKNIITFGIYLVLSFLYFTFIISLGREHGESRKR